MSMISALRSGAAILAMITIVIFEFSKAAMVFITKRDASKKIFKRTLLNQKLPEEVVEELSQTYDANLIHIRELVRSRGPW